MFNLIFNIEHEWYCLHFKPGALSVKQSILMKIKLFVNVLCIALIFTTPVSIVFICSYLLNNICN